MDNYWNEVNRLMETFARLELTQLDLKCADFSLKLKRGAAEDGQSIVSVQPVLAGQVASAESAQLAAEPEQQEDSASSSDVIVKAPLAGIFYRASKPGEDPYVEPGQTIRKGETIGLIEAMKIMNEIPAPCDGTVEEILMEDSAFAGYEDGLIRIRENQHV